VLIASARIVLAEAESAVQKARRAGRGELGLLRIGFTASASFNPFVTGAIRDFRTTYPDVEVELVEEATSFLLDRFATGRLDVAFLRPAPGEVDHLLSQRAVAEPLVVAMPSNHKQASRKSVSLTSLADDAFILYPRPNGRALFDSIVSACQAAGFSPKLLQVAPQLTSVVNLVAHRYRRVDRAALDGAGGDRRRGLSSPHPRAESRDHAGQAQSARTALCNPVCGAGALARSEAARALRRPGVAFID